MVQKKFIEMQMKKFNFSFETNLIKKNQLKNIKLTNKKINLINVDLNFKKSLLVKSQKNLPNTLKNVLILALI